MKDHERGKDTDYKRKDPFHNRFSKYLPIFVAALLVFLLVAMAVQLKNIADMPVRRRCSTEVCLQAILDGPPVYDNPVQARIIQRQYLTAPSPGPLNLTSGTSDDETFANLKNKLKSIINHKTHGRFLVLGAGDGEYQDLTLDLERTMGWTGLLVEPHPELFQMLSWKRRNAELCSAALSPIAHPTRVTLTHPSPSPSLTEQQKILHYRQSKIKAFNLNLTEPITRHTVQALTLPAMVFASSTITDRINLLVMDMAGSDNLVVDQVVWSKMPPIDVIAVLNVNTEDAQQLKLLVREVDMSMQSLHLQKPAHKDQNQLIFYKTSESKS